MILGKDEDVHMPFTHILHQAEKGSKWALGLPCDIKPPRLVSKLVLTVEILVMLQEDMFDFYRWLVPTQGRNNRWQETHP